MADETTIRIVVDGLGPQPGRGQPGTSAAQQGGDAYAPRDSAAGMAMLAEIRAREANAKAMDFSKLSNPLHYVAGITKEVEQFEKKMADLKLAMRPDVVDARIDMQKQLAAEEKKRADIYRSARNEPAIDMAKNRQSFADEMRELSESMNPVILRERVYQERQLAEAREKLAVATEKMRSQFEGPQDPVADRMKKDTADFKKAMDELALATNPDVVEQTAKYEKELTNAREKLAVATEKMRSHFEGPRYPVAEMMGKEMGSFNQQMKELEKSLHKGVIRERVRMENELAAAQEKVNRAMEKERNRVNPQDVLPLIDLTKEAKAFEEQMAMLQEAMKPDVVEQLAKQELELNKARSELTQKMEEKKQELAPYAEEVKPQEPQQSWWGKMLGIGKKMRGTIAGAIGGPLGTVFGAGMDIAASTNDMIEAQAKSQEGQTQEGYPAKPQTGGAESGAGDDATKGIENAASMIPVIGTAVAAAIAIGTAGQKAANQLTEGVGTFTAAMVSASESPSEDRKSTRLNSSHIQKSRMPSSA